MSKFVVALLISLFCLTNALVSTDFFQPPFYAQEDPRWGNVTLGYGPATIGESGCLLNSVASMIAGEGIYVNGVIPDPLVMNEWLLENNGFTDGYGFVWESIEPLGFKLEGFVNDTASAIAALDSGKRIFLHVDNANHYVLALSDTGYGFNVMDPFFIGRVWKYDEVSQTTIYSVLV